MTDHARAPATYRERPSCATCRHVFRRGEHDEGNSFYCTLRAPPRPLCQSVAMDEYDFSAPRDERIAAGRVWREWRAGREVSERGICDEHQEKKR